MGLPGLAARTTARKRDLALAGWRKLSKMEDVTVVGSSSSAPSTTEDVIVVGSSSSTPSTSWPTTAAEIVAIAKQAAVAGVSQFEVASRILMSPAASAKKDSQQTLDGKIITTTKPLLSQHCILPKILLSQHRIVPYHNIVLYRIATWYCTKVTLHPPPFAIHYM